MRKILAVAWREFKHTALTKAFIIGTIIFPMIIWGGMAIVPMLIKPTTTTVEGTLAIVDASGEISTAALIEYDPERLAPRSLLEKAEAGEDIDAAEVLGGGSGNPFSSRVAFDISIEPHTDDHELESIYARVRSGDLLAAAVVTDEAFDHSRSDGVTFLVATAANPDHVEAMRRALGRSIVRARADRAGMDVEELQAMVQPPKVSTRRLTDEGEATAGIELQKALPIIFMILLWICAFASGNYLLTSTIEEKSNKVMEVLLSAVSPMQLMAGKILGQAIVGLFTISVYGALGIAALVAFSMQDLIQPSMILYLAMYFFMAYFMVASIMAAIGSAVSDLQEAHALITPAMLVLFLPMILFIPISQSPNGMLATVSSFIPVLTPFVMIIRVTAAEPVPLWQIIAATSVGFVGVFLMVWMAARVFRVGVLMYGKPPSPMELIKWMRYT